MDVIKSSKLARLYRMRNCVYDAMFFYDPLFTGMDILEHLEKLYDDLTNQIDEILPK